MKHRNLQVFVFILFIVAFISTLSLLQRIEQSITPLDALQNYRPLAGFEDPRLAPVEIIEKPRNDYCEDLDFLVAIHVEADDIKTRQLWRETYGITAEKFNYKLLFVVGFTNESNTPNAEDSIKMEAEIFGDILQSNFLDVHKNLTYKHLSLLRYYYDTCGSNTVLLKMDVNMIWRMDEAALIAKAHSNNKADEIWGWMPNSFAVQRNITQKRYVSPDEFANDFFPPYCVGSVYFTSRSSVSKLLSVLRSVPFFWMYDVFVTGFVRSAAGVGLKKLNFAICLENSCDWRLNTHRKDITFFNVPKNELEAAFLLVNRHAVI